MRDQRICYLWPWVMNKEVSYFCNAMNFTFWLIAELQLINDSRLDVYFILNSVRFK